MASEPGFDPLAILRVLAHHTVPYVVVGGFAVAAHKVVRATRDLDLVTDRTWRAAQRLAAALIDLESEPSGDEAVTWTPEVLARPINVRIATRYGEVHLLNATDGIPSYLAMDRVTVRVENVDVSVASLDAVRAMKRAAGRPKDLIDLAELEVIHGPAK